MADSQDEKKEAAADFGSCCDELREALEAQGFEPFIVIGEDGVLYMSVGEVEVDDDQRGFVDHPIFFCPFCGTEVQDRDEVMEKINSENSGTGSDDDPGDRKQ